MFEQMITDLRSGIFPEMNLLRKRFDAALVKKIGVIKTPYSFWPADTKINPPAKQLLWAAMLLRDKENYKLIEAIITSELEEQLSAKGKLINNPDLVGKTRQLIVGYSQELVNLAPNEIFKDDLRHIVDETFPLN